MHFYGGQQVGVSRGAELAAVAARSRAEEAARVTAEDLASARQALAQVTLCAYVRACVCVCAYACVCALRCLHICGHDVLLRGHDACK